MGTMVDYSYRFEGRADEIAKARAAIKAVQRKYAKVSGNGNCDFEAKPEVGGDGALTWYCYATGGMDDFEDDILALTAASRLRCLAYWGCTDGDSSGGLNLFESGNADGVGAWDADIGADAALAIRSLSEASNVEAFLTLVDTLRVAGSDGWDEDDYPWLLRASVVAGVMAEALALHQDLIQDELVRKALLDMKTTIEEVRAYLAEYGEPTDDVARLAAMIEGMEILAVVSSPKSRKKRPARI